jgi:hypothetical protein
VSRCSFLLSPCCVSMAAASPAALGPLGLAAEEGSRAAPLADRRSGRVCSTVVARALRVRLILTPHHKRRSRVAVVAVWARLGTRREAYTLISIPIYLVPRYLRNVPPFRPRRRFQHQCLPPT